MRQRLLRGSAATLTVTLADQNGSPADAAGAVTVSVARADGTVLLAAGTATSHAAGAVGVYTVALTAAQTATLDLLTAVWTDAGDGSTFTTAHEVVGGYFFSLAEARASNDGLLADVSKYPDARLFEARQEVEEEAELICDVAFVPRYSRLIVSGLATPELTLPVNRIRAIRSVRTYPVIGGANSVALTAAQLASIEFDVDGDGSLFRTDYGVFDEGRGNIVVEVEHGWDGPPGDFKRAALRRLRDRLNFDKTGISERTTSYTAENGQTYQLATPDAYSTGVPDVDAAYQRYSFREDGTGKLKAVSRPLNLDPQRYSVFHGGVR